VEAKEHGITQLVQVVALVVEVLIVGREALVFMMLITL
jgi:hypothetical protein